MQRPTIAASAQFKPHPLNKKTVIKPPVWRSTVKEEDMESLLGQLDRIVNTVGLLMDRIAEKLDLDTDDESGGDTEEEDGDATVL